MDWPNDEQVPNRYKSMLGLMRGETGTRSSLLDLGCGAGLIVDYLESTGLIGNVEYYGLDISSAMIETAARLHAGYSFECRDILRKPLDEKSFDYVIMNGLLTERVTLTYCDMERFAMEMVSAAFAACRKGIAFNVMNTHVDWCRTDLFHWPLDRAAEFLVRSCSRHLVFKMDYGLYEYTIYCYRETTL